jgi:hypothetical protein
MYGFHSNRSKFDDFIFITIFVIGAIAVYLVIPIAAAACLGLLLYYALVGMGVF